jgi:hypothetical protein
MEERQSGRKRHQRRIRKSRTGMEFGQGKRCRPRRSIVLQFANLQSDSRDPQF